MEKLKGGAESIEDTCSAKSTDGIQSWTFAYIRLLNNPYVNGVSLSKTNPKNGASLLNLAVFWKED